MNVSDEIKIVLYEVIYIYSEIVICFSMTLEITGRIEIGL